MLFLAIDSGGTSTRCLLADSTRVLARASTGSVKPMRVPEEEATARLATMLAEVAAAAGVSLSAVTRTCFGLAGFTSAAGRAWAARTIAAHVSGSLLLVGDEEIALDAAFAGGPGILVIAGTGAIAIGRAPSGQLVHAGGFGPVLGDEGSGFWIGLEAIRAALRAQDHEFAAPPTSSLLTEIQAHWDLASTSDLIAFGNQRTSDGPVPDFASLAPVVARCAAAGDPLSAQILHRAGDALAALVTLVARKLSAAGLPSSNPEPRTSNPAVAFTGSVLTHIVPVREAMSSSLAASLPAARVQPHPVDPLDGALYRARHG